MAKAVASPVQQLIRRLVEDPQLRDLPDQALLRRYDAQRDEAAFRTLLRRHGPMVLDVCRGVLGHEQDAEDAFQATFLLFAQKAASIRKAAALGSWLHGVARRTALKARAKSAARGKHETRAPERPAATDDLSWREVRQVVHEELGGIPEQYREPLVLCYLEGMTQQRAAARLGVAERTLRDRLERGRELVRARLARRGLGPVAVLVTAAWPTAEASAGVPAALVCSTVQVATAAAAVPARIAALTTGVLPSMLANKLKVATAVFLGAAMVGSGALTCCSAAGDQPPPKSSSRVEVAQAKGNDPTGPDAGKPVRAKTPDEEYKALDREYEVGAKEIGKALQAAKTVEERQAVQEGHNRRRADFARRFLGLAKRDPKDPIGWDAAMWVRNNASDLPEGTAAAALMAEHHPFHKYMGGAVGDLITALPEPKGVELARTVLDRHPDPQARGMAGLALARHYRRQAKLARRCEEEPEKAAEALGREKADRLRKEAESLANEAERMYALVAEKYGDARYGKDGTLAAEAERELSILRNAPGVAVGKAAPDTAGEDIDGKPLKLSDYRGKVVVVCFWATWCPPCMRMVPHERDLAKRLKDKPFVLLGVNNDHDVNRDKVKERVKKDEITWRSWWDGNPTGPIATRWCVEGWPAVYVLDAKGVIRYKGVTGEELDAAVDALLKELGADGGRKD